MISQKLKKKWLAEGYKLAKRKMLLAEQAQTPLEKLVDAAKALGFKVVSSSDKVHTGGKLYGNGIAEVICDANIEKKKRIVNDEEYLYKIEDYIDTKTGFASSVYVQLVSGQSKNVYDKSLDNKYIVITITDGSTLGIKNPDIKQR